MYDEQTKNAILKYRKKSIKRIALDVPIAEYALIKSFCDDHNESVSGYIRRIVKENIEKS